MLNKYGSYSFREAVSSDEPFIRNLYSITLRSQMPWDQTGLSDEQIEAIIRHQLDAQTLHYSSNYPFAEISIIECEGKPVGRLIIIEFENEVRLGDIMVLPEHQNKGICKYVMREYIALGLATKRPIRLHVEKMNWAVALYQREQFVVIEDQSSHWLMEYRPEEKTSADEMVVNAEKNIN